MAEIESGEGPKAVTPPEGTDIYRYGQNSFGLASMTHQEVYDKPGRGGGNFIEGATLRFMPGELHVTARRQNFTAEEINRVGELTKALHDMSVIDRYLSSIKKAAEDAKANLRASAWSAPGVTSETTPEEIDTRTEKVLEEETGISPVYLQTKQEALKEKLAALNAEAYRLGVLYISSISSWSYSVTPPKETTETL